ncbi:hypothetical protein Misp05_58870 [Micromonospora sp. NBRC 107095]|nr:hypothetical protein Misp05_58870 [Micromonospora sp. NBRC 107095]
MAILIIRLRGDSVDDVFDVMADESGRLAQALTDLDDRYPYLSCIDQYGITVFNRLQSRMLLAEIARVRGEPQFASLAGLLDRLSALAERCAQGAHLFVEIEGD